MTQSRGTAGPQREMRMGKIQAVEIVRVCAVSLSHFVALRFTVSRRQVDFIGLNTVA